MGSQDSPFSPSSLQQGLHSHWPIPLSGQRRRSGSLQAGACHQLLLPALELLGILYSNRSSGEARLHEDPDMPLPNSCHIP